MELENLRFVVLIKQKIELLYPNNAKMNHSEVITPQRTNLRVSFPVLQ